MTEPIATDWQHRHEEAEAAASDLRSTVAIRQRCGQLLERARRGESAWFEVVDSQIEGAARQVADLTHRRFGKHVPFHSRWRHFEAGGIDRRAQLEQRLHAHTHVQPAHAFVDLTVVSVLLDAGAGEHWKYVEPASGQTFTRSEGLAVASYHAFCAGLFSSDKDRPLQVDAMALRALPTDLLAEALQVSDANPLIGLESRAILLRRLGEVMQEQPETFGPEVPRPSGLFDLIVGTAGPDTAPTADVNAHDILSHVLMSLSGIWPTANRLGNVPLGDCWRHAAVRGPGVTDGWVPFHKLSQWMTYSLIEPFVWGGSAVHGLQALTGLPEYRNGGFLIDSGVLKLRDEAAAHTTWQVGDEIIVEWRALTVALLDEVAGHVRRQLRMSEVELPLAGVLEGGTWAAGRELARKLRGGLPPLKVASDGTVF